MAVANNLSTQFQGFANLPALRQVGLLVGLAASVALGVAIVLWSQEPNYSVLFAGMADKDKAEVMTALDQAAIPYKMDAASGALLVPAAKVHDARIRLATAGLPKASGSGFELLDKDSGLGTSRMVETARYHRALEGELARSVMSLAPVESARVHLAIPKQSVFVRNRTQPSASVLLSLYAGRVLSEEQVAGIVHLVASSVPELEPEQVTVVDQRGNLLTARHAGADSALRDERFKFARRLEETYTQRIHDLLSPIVGAEGVRAQVTADVDFTVVETTSEVYNPDTQIVRSEQSAEDTRLPGAQGGVPGALTNQPPPAGTVEFAQNVEDGPQPLSTSRRVTRNYEVDRTISHSKPAPGSIRRLSVAVVVDYREQVNAEGQIERLPLPAEEIERLSALVREAVGFDALRGDSVNVMNVSFKEPSVAAAEQVPQTPIWQEAWVWDGARQLLGALGVLALVLFVLRPVLKSLATHAPRAQGQGQLALPGGEGSPEALLGEERLSLTNQSQGVPRLTSGASYDDHLGAAKTLVKDDPKRVAQVVKTWISTDE